MHERAGKRDPTFLFPFSLSLSKPAGPTAVVVEVVVVTSLSEVDGDAFLPVRHYSFTTLFREILS